MMNNICRSFAIVAAVLMAGFCTDAARAAEPAVVYKWNPDSFRNSTNPWNGEKVTRPDGGVTQKISGTGMGWNNYIFVPAGRLKGGGEYTAILKYEIVTPTIFPSSFYMFARSKKLGQAADIWMMWNGDPGDTGTARLPLRLKNTDDWVFYAGCKGPGTMIIDSLSIVEGIGLTYVPAKAVSAVPVALPAPPNLPTGSAPIVIDAPKPKTNIVINAVDFGLKADGPDGPASPEVAIANGEAFKKAIKASRDQNAAKLTMPRGVYHISVRDMVPFEKLTDLTIDGQGSEWIFTRLAAGQAMLVSNCSRVVFRDIKIDWDWSTMPIGSLAKVLSVLPDGTGADIAFPESTPAEVELTKKAPWTHISEIEPDSLVRIGHTRYGVAVANIENIDATTLRVRFKAPVDLTAGETYAIRHLYYEMAAFKVASSNHTVFDGVTIYSIPGMGWICTADIHHIKLVNCKIDRRPGSRRVLTAAADGFHIGQSQGNIELDNVTFTGAGDDSINIHDNCFQGVQRVDDHTLVLVDCPPWRIRLNPGDKIELFKASYEPMGIVLTVKSAVFKDKNTTVTLEEALPANLSPLTIVQNKRYETRNVRIANCKFVDATGRGILLSAKDATVENNLFRNSVSTGIQFHTEIVQNLWAEGYGASNIVVRGNTFENTSKEGRYENAVIYTGAKLPAGITAYPLFHDLLIENNRFINSPGPAVSLQSAGNVTVRNNIIENPKNPPEANALSGSIMASYTSNAALGGNVWKAQPDSGKPGVLYDPATTSGITATDNTVVK